MDKACPCPLQAPTEPSRPTAHGPMTQGNACRHCRETVTLLSPALLKGTGRACSRAVRQQSLA